MYQHYKSYGYNVVCIGVETYTRIGMTLGISRSKFWIAGATTGLFSEWIRIPEKHATPYQAAVGEIKFHTEGGNAYG